jgi:nucleoside-diphosphate-sugar epimerase
VSLEDAVEGLARLALGDSEKRPAAHTVYNQVTQPISIVEVAETIASVGEDRGLEVAVEHFENPREEDETHRMEIANDRYADLIGEGRMDFEEGMTEVIDALHERRGTISAHEDRFLPDVLE